MTSSPPDSATSGNRSQPGPNLGRTVRSSVILLGLVLIFPGCWAAEVIEIPAAADTALIEWEPDFNLGLQSDLPAGTLGPNAGVPRSRLLIRFDLSPLPAEASIQSAVLRCRIVKEPGDAVGSVFSVRRMLKPWDEGRGDGLPPGGSTAEPGEVTWNDQLAGSAAWTVPGGYPDEDFVENPSASERVDGLGTVEFELGALGLQDLEDWRLAPEVNYGWMLLTESEEVPKTARRFAGREAGLDAPRLVVHYLEPAPSPRIVDLQIAPDMVVLLFEAQADVPYVWEERSSLVTGSWTPVFIIPPPPTAGVVAVTNSAAPGDLQFIRLRVGL